MVCLCSILYYFIVQSRTDRAMASGFAFISANYQLLPPATGHQLLEDIKHLFAFLENGINDVCIANGRNDHIDMERIAVVGTSAGGLCAYLAGIHAKPKPKAILSMYGMGGDFFVRIHLTISIALVLIYTSISRLVTTCLQRLHHFSVDVNCWIRTHFPNFCSQNQ